MKVYVTNKPETLGIATSEDDVRLKEVRMWFKTDDEIKVQSLADHDKQVRKEVCEKIRENAISHNNLEVDMYYISPQQLYEIEQGEQNGNNN